MRRELGTANNPAIDFTGEGARLELQKAPCELAVEYGLIQKRDTGAAARIYLQSFPGRAQVWFHKEECARAFYRDLMEFMRLTYGQTFFAAYSDGCLVGYLILTLPGTVLLGSLFKDAFIVRVVWRALRGCYGFSFSTLTRATKSLLAIPNTRAERRVFGTPHIYVVAVDRESTGKGIGSALIERARLSCGGKFSEMSLFVERENTGAIRLYERTGFRVVESSVTEHLMVRELR
jgi:ribosomal protein S18 acetylase RimI-like enzyme